MIDEYDRVSRELEPDDDGPYPERDYMSAYLMDAEEERGNTAHPGHPSNYGSN